jgi:transposase-like protein
MLAKDPNNSQIIRNYVAMPDRPQFSGADVVEATGVCRKTVANVLRGLELAGDIIRTARRIDGRIHYRAVSEQERARTSLASAAKSKPVAMIARENGVSRETVYKRLRSHQVFPAKFLSQRQADVLGLLKDGRERWAFALQAYETLIQLERKALITREKQGRFYRCRITAKGREVLDAQSKL